MNIHFTQSPPLSLYLHYPWCVQKCPYCDFNSHAVKGELAEGAYIDALIADLERELPAVWGRPVVSLFIGGGTPSLMSPEGLEQLLSAIRARLRLLPGAEITLEANPGTVDAGRFRAFREAGVNRLSIGVQSFQDDLLRRIGRIHDRAEAIRAAEAARAAGFERLNLDLMFGLPGQSPAQARADIETALALKPDHLSYYQLTLEPNTAFHQSPPPLPEDDAVYGMQVGGQIRLAEAGYRQYEVSAYAREGARCIHNLNYWHFGDYLGIGPGAHGKITDAPTGRISRRWKVRHPRDYLAQAATDGAVAGESTLSAEDALLEFMMNALRLTEGFDTRLFCERTGLPLDAVQAPLDEAQRLGLLRWDLRRVHPTGKGRMFLNELLELFLAEN